jgi:hypothetical protein
MKERERERERERRRGIGPEPNGKVTASEQKTANCVQAQNELIRWHELMKRHKRQWTTCCHHRRRRHHQHHHDRRHRCVDRTLCKKGQRRNRTGSDGSNKSKKRAHAEYVQVAFGSIVAFGQHLQLKAQLLILGQQSVAFGSNCGQFVFKRIDTIQVFANELLVLRITLVGAHGSVGQTGARGTGSRKYISRTWTRHLCVGRDRHRLESMWFANLVRSQEECPNTDWIEGFLRLFVSLASRSETTKQMMMMMIHRQY